MWARRCVKGIPCKYVRIKGDDLELMPLLFKRVQVRVRENVGMWVRLESHWHVLEGGSGNAIP